MDHSTTLSRGAATRPALVLLATSLGVLVAQVDTSVVSLAVKRIGADLGATVSGMQWMMDAYNVAYAALELPMSLVLLAEAYPEASARQQALGISASGDRARFGRRVRARRAPPGRRARAPRALREPAVLRGARDRGPHDVRHVRAALPHAALLPVAARRHAVRGGREAPAALDRVRRGVAMERAHRPGDRASRGMAGGMAAMGTGELVLAFISADTHGTIVSAALAIVGAGLGLNTAPVNSVAVAHVPRARGGTASGLLNTARIVGATLGIAILGAVFARYAGQHGNARDFLAGLRPAFAVGGLAELAGALVALRYIAPHSGTARD
jgi:hypothetical protein